jgi:hypothetical protein
MTMPKVMIIIFLLLVTPGQVRGDLYQYRSSDGSVIITDDVNKVPDDQRERARFKEIAPPVPAGQDAAPAPELKTRKRRPAQERSSDDGGPRRQAREAVSVPARDDGPRNENETEEMKKLRAWTRERVDSESGSKDQKPDPKYATPEATWSAFKDALMSGDMEMALDCFLPASATRYRQSFTEFGRDKMMAMGRDMRPIRRIAQNGKNGKYVTRKNEFGQEISYLIYFDYLSGNWKINQF